MAVSARMVDPRDVNVEIDAPRYRVYFWTRSRSSREFEIGGADVDVVIEWAETNRRTGETYTLHVVERIGGDVVLLRLKGSEPPSSGDAGLGSPANASG